MHAANEKIGRSTDLEPDGCMPGTRYKSCRIACQLTTESAALNDPQGSTVSLCCGISQQADTAAINPCLFHQSIQTGDNLLSRRDRSAAPAKVRSVKQLWASCKNMY